MRAVLAACAMIASLPAFAQEFTVTSTLVMPLTGPGAPTEMQKLDICGTDLGTIAELGGTIVIAFGDTFGWRGDICPKFGPNLRSNVIGFTTDKDPSDGVVIEDWLRDDDGRAVAAVEGQHMPPFSGEQTRIPTAMVAVGDTLYMHYMSVRGFTMEGAWLCNWSRFIASTDGGRTWDGGVSEFGDFQSSFNMLALSGQSGMGNEDGKYVYAVGTPCGRSNGARVGRVEANMLQQKAAWEYWDGAGWSKERAQAAEVIKPGVGEGSLVWNAGIQRWMYAALNVLSSALEIRFAERPEGPWSEPAILVLGSDYAQPYGAFMTPSWIADDGLTFYFVMSQFGLYNTYVMKAELNRQ